MKTNPNKFRLRFTRLLVGVGALVLLHGFGIAIFVTPRMNDLVALGVAHEINNPIHK